MIQAMISMKQSDDVDNFKDGVLAKEAQSWPAAHSRDATGTGRRRSATSTSTGATTPRSPLSVNSQKLPPLNLSPWANHQSALTPASRWPGWASALPGPGRGSSLSWCSLYSRFSYLSSTFDQSLHLLPLFYGILTRSMTREKWEAEQRDLGHSLHGHYRSS